MRAFFILAMTCFTLSLSVSPSTAATKKPFDGQWPSCFEWQGQQICVGDTLKQKEDRICGLWSNWASNSWYNGRLIAKATGRSASIEYVCGTPGGTTQTECESATRKDDKRGWQRSTDSYLICKGKLYGGVEDDVTTCEKVDKEYGVTRVKKSKTLWVSDDDKKWIDQCLNDPDYPPASTILPQYK